MACLGDLSMMQVIKSIRISLVNWLLDRRVTLFIGILGILSDLSGVVFLWWNPANIAWYWKLLISVVLVFIAIALFLVSSDSAIAKVTDYSWEEGKPILLFCNKNTYYTIDMLVSVYYKVDNKCILCAIGCVVADPTKESLHIQIIHRIDRNTFEKIKISTQQHKHFFIFPSVTPKDIQNIKWK